MDHPDTRQTEAPARENRGCESSCTVVGLAACLIAGAGLGWGAALVERFRAPVLIFPILTGLVVGLCSAGLMQVCRVPARRAAVWGAVLAAAVAVVAQHYASYDTAWRVADREERLLAEARQAFPELVEKRLPPPPASFLDYLQSQAEQGRVTIAIGVVKGPAAWLTWGVDAALVMAAAAVVALRTTRRNTLSKQ
ncbi:MAG: hypothetical protein ACYC35_10125 [Pirellulales bacterium]